MLKRWQKTLIDPTVEEVWEKYLELMTWAGFPDIVNDHKREAERKRRNIEQATPQKRRELYSFYDRNIHTIALNKMSKSL